mgnify:FL=1
MVTFNALIPAYDMINKTELKFTAFSITSVRAEQKAEDNNTSPKFRIGTDKKGQMYFRVKQEEFNRLNKLRQSIACTPFEVKDKYPSSMPVDTVINDGIYCLIEPYKLFELADRLPKNAFKYLMIICKELLPDTNIITLVGTEVAKKYNFNVAHIQSYNAILCDLNIIVRTDVQSTFVINHNIIYKGDLNKFAKNYKEMYHDSVPERINYTKIKLSNKKAYVNKNKAD